MQIQNEIFDNNISLIDIDLFENFCRRGLDHTHFFTG